MAPDRTCLSSLSALVHEQSNRSSPSAHPAAPDFAAGSLAGCRNSVVPRPISSKGVTMTLGRWKIAVAGAALTLGSLGGRLAAQGATITGHITSREANI